MRRICDERGRDELRRPAPSSQARTVAALKCLFRFCVESEYLDRDPAMGLRTPKKREALFDVLDRRELARLLLAVFAYAGPRSCDVAAQLPLLSTLVGHVDPKASYW